MKEYIEREETIRELKKILNRMLEGNILQGDVREIYKMAYRHCIGLISLLPAANVSEVVQSVEALKHGTGGLTMGDYISMQDAVQCADDVAADFENDGLTDMSIGARTVGSWLKDMPAAEGGVE